MAESLDVHGYVLHSRAWKESSLLLDFFSLEKGLIRASARGAKKDIKKHSLAQLLQPYTGLKLTLASSHDYYHLQSLDPLEPRLALTGDASLCAFYCNELLMRLLPERDAHAELFNQYRHTLHALLVSKDFASELRSFECVLIESLGYSIDFEYDKTGNAVIPEAFYRVHDDGVSMVVSADNHCVTGLSLMRMANKQWSLEPECSKRIFRQLLLPHLGDKPLQSKDLWLAKKRLTV